MPPIQVHRIAITLLFYCLSTISAYESEGGITDLTPYLQPDNVLDGPYDSFPTNNSNLCARRCDGRPKICYYRFVVEPYDTVGPACRNCPNNSADCSRPQCVAADGFEKAIITINRRLPGPSIYVCQNDRVIVDVKNGLYDKALTVHWHGITQRGTPYMDGVPMVTQCPIMGGQTFRYDFRTPRPGTFFWHSHDGLQKVDGFQGPFIVRAIEGNDFHRNLYSNDLPSHTFFLTDWLRTSADDRLPGLLTRNTGQTPDTFLINGKGVQAASPPTSNQGLTPMTIFRVKRNGLYRLRFIFALCLDCAAEVSIQSHRMQLITTDGGNPVKPKDISSISGLSADRFDVVINANQNVGTYWIFIRGLGACAGGAGITQYALLKYEGSTQELPPNANNVVNGPVVRFNLPNQFCNASSPQVLCINQIQGAIPPPRHILQNSQRRNLVIQFGFHDYTLDTLFVPNKYQKFYIPVVTPPRNPLMFRAAINNITFEFPSSPFMDSRRRVPEEEFCPRKCYEGYGDINECVCFNFYKVALRTTLLIIVADTGIYNPNGLNHPFHLHGYDFYILETGYFFTDRETSLRNLLHRINTQGIDNPSPPLKDVVGVPSGGYVVLAIYTDNPGCWLFHCHFTMHFEMGMGAVLQTGERNEFPPPPPDFPTCHNYLPEVSV